MKILHLCLTAPYSDNFSYQENLLAKYQKKAGNNVYIIASEWYWGEDGKVKKTERKRYCDYNGVNIVRLPIKENKKNVFFKFKKYLNFSQTIQEIGPDVIFVHNIQFFDILKLINLKKKNPNIKIYVDNHADFSNSAKGCLKKIFYCTVWRYLAQKISPYVEIFWGVLPARVDFLRKIFKISNEKSKLLIMGGDDESIEKASLSAKNHRIRKKFNISENSFLIITGGKIDKFKEDVLLLMDVVKKMDVDNEINDVELVVFGSLSSEIQKKFYSKLGYNIKFIGWLDQQTAYDLFAEADLGVFLGRHSVYWEQAVSQALPLICKKWGNMSHLDLGGNIKFLENVNFDNVEKLIKKVRTSDYPEMLRAADSKERTKYFYSKIAKKSVEG